MAKLSPAQILGLARSAGWSENDAVTAAAVALAESNGGNPLAVGDLGLRTGKWGPSIGLWQIRSLNADRGSGRTRDELANRDPATNARHAHQVWAEAGGRFTPWTTYNTGAWRLYLPRVTAAGPGAQPVGNIEGQPVIGLPFIDLPGGLNPLTPLDAAKNMASIAAKAVELAVKAAAWMADRDNWSRIAKVVIGTGLIIQGSTRLTAQAAMNSQAVTRALSVVGGASPTKLATKAVKSTAAAASTGAAA